jgi:hypothetical protein
VSCQGDWLYSFGNGTPSKIFKQGIKKIISVFYKDDSDRNRGGIGVVRERLVQAYQRK